MPEWLIPVLTFITGGLGGYLGASRKVIILETRMEELMLWRERSQRSLVEHNEDILVHDIEIQALCARAGMPRAQRQRFRDE